MSGGFFVPRDAWECIAMEIGSCTLTYDTCGKVERPDMYAIADYLRSGWPKHCGETMKISPYKPRGNG